MALARDTSAFTRSRRNRRTTRVLQKFPEGPSSMRIRPTAQLDRTQVRDLRGKDVGSREFAHRDAPGRVGERTEKPKWVLKSQDTSRARARNRQGLPVYVERDKGDPIGGFLGAVKKAVTFGNDEVIRTAKGVYKGLNENVEANIPGTRAWDRRRKRERGQQMALEVSPAGLMSLLRAGGGQILNNPESVYSMLKRIPDTAPRPFPRVVERNPDVLGGNMHVEGRLPWVVGKQHGTVRVGPVGVEHAKLYPKGAEADDWWEGWLYNAYEHDPKGVQQLELAVRGLKRMRGDELSSAEQKGLYKLLELLFGPGSGSPATDDMIRPFDSYFR